MRGAQVGLTGWPKCVYSSMKMVVFMLPLLTETTSTIEEKIHTCTPTNTIRNNIEDHKLFKKI